MHCLVVHQDGFSRTRLKCWSSWSERDFAHFLIFTLESLASMYIGVHFPACLRACVLACVGVRVCVCVYALHSEVVLSFFM